LAAGLAESRLAVQRRVEIVPPWPVRLPGGGMDGVMRRRGTVLERLLHVGDEQVVVRAAQPRPDNVVIGAWGPHVAACDTAIARMRFAFGLDEDLRDFHRRFSRDPLLGAAIRRRPWVRPRRRPEPFEALAWAICEQLIEYVRAAAIQRRIVARMGPRCAATGLRDVPSAAILSGCAPALLESYDLAASRAITLVRAAREVARGRVDLHDPDHERAWRRLRAIPGIGSWTVEVLALNGQGRLDQVPAGDLGLLKWAGRLLSGGDPRAVATEAQVRELFAPYAPYGGLAACYALGG
jgi:3-methyladenine DNA glycosylase/8-oxoguanine DNA glycosylase